jgi:hypothetical protein
MVSMMGILSGAVRLLVDVRQTGGGPIDAAGGEVADDSAT